jgi:cellulose synthase/poly-beta-1,6-N-acetylglucosamine synthase-like glycosyltransferase
MGLGGVCQSTGTALLGVAALVAAGWLWAGIQLLVARRRMPSLADVLPLADSALPSLTVVAAARDESARVEHAVQSLLAQDYPGLQVVVADDRSVDGTGTILDRLAATDRRLRVIHVQTLPEGWIGKCHALAEAAAKVTSEWLLFTDGDVSFASDAVRRAVSLALAEGADHLAVAPHLIVEGLGEAAFTGYFVVMFHLSQRPWLARDPRSAAAVGIGAFNLVRRDAYERSGGHERIRYELIDDLALGKSLKRSGARQLFALDGNRVHARWHVGARGLIHGVEKNAFAAFRYRTILGVLAVGAQLLLALTPVAALFFPGWAPKVAAAAAWIGVALAFGATYWGARHRWLSAALMPLGGILFSYAILRSIVLANLRRGIYWRGTFYPLERLRQESHR